MLLISGPSGRRDQRRPRRAHFPAPDKSVPVSLDIRGCVVDGKHLPGEIDHAPKRHEQIAFAVTSFCSTGPVGLARRSRESKGIRALNPSSSAKISRLARA
jgi:hypothetical protein